MQIVMVKTTKNVGKVGEVIDVKRGYALNFLIPEGYSLPATKGYIKEAKNRARKYDKAAAVDDSAMTEFIKEIAALELVIKEKASDKGVLFGSVRAEDIVEELAKKISKSIDPDYILLKDPIKKIGEYEIDIKAGENVGKLKVKIEAE